MPPEYPLPVFIAQLPPLSHWARRSQSLPVLTAGAGGGGGGAAVVGGAALVVGRGAVVGEVVDGRAVLGVVGSAVAVSAITGAAVVGATVVEGTTAITMLGCPPSVDTTAASELCGPPSSS